MMKIRNILVSLAVLTGTASFAQLPDAATIAAKMYPGWNLGNTMEANNSGQNFTNNVGLGGETAWQSTKTTQEVIDFVKSQGFRSVRIPCNWVCGHISDASAVTIDAQWMARVKEIVDYCIGSGLYVLLNDHYDGGWVQNTLEDVSEATVTQNCATMKIIWTQIATTFKDYDEHLLLAGMNEPGLDKTFKAENVAALQKYEQAFIDAVRATGGNNATRTLVVQGPSTDIDQTYNLYEMSGITDPAGSGRLMLEVHFYSPWQFCGLEEDADWGKAWYFWGSANHVPSGTLAVRNTSSSYEESYVQSQFKKMKTKYADKGYPIILGEYGCQWRNVGNTVAQNRHNASVKLFHQTVNQQGPTNGIVPFVWDINVQSQGGTKGIMTVLNRSAKSVYCSYAMDGITAGVTSTTWGGPTSGISTVPFDRSADSKDAATFNILGQRVSPDAKGLVIIGGKKYVRR